MARSSSYGLGLACFAVAVAVAGATQFTVGGANGWSIPGAGAEPLNTWAERTRFQVGDSLVFVYPKDQDSVLLVEPADYNACNTSSYVKKFDNGDTVFTLDHSGAFFFISGVEANCRANEKLIVMVLAAGRNDTSGGAAPPPTAAAPPPPTSSTTPPPPASPAPKAPAAASPPPASSASAPPPASAPTTTPSAPPPASSPPAPGASLPAPVSSTPPPSAPARAPEAPPAPSASSPAPSAQGTTANSTGTPSPRPAGSKDKNGAALAVASGLASSLGACALGYAMLAL
ncbi:hypothetical protein PAHAL_1G046000 [Panicum hallii]|uniref:Phytocyanin domain-containing protein n=1 Tax=Panicum hallii TaxID=206008 RepID=A0A2S3GLJ7_9POAL|nr:early nodulin-like protein 2 [Panicum hallii]PAN04153.1 hypothetical protein PAHAL_1G046000 [Panicum hallii]